MGNPGESSHRSRTGVPSSDHPLSASAQERRARNRTWEFFRLSALKIMCPLPTRFYVCISKKWEA